MNYYQIGKIIGTHGLKGEVKIYSTSDFDDERYEIGNTVYLYHEGTYQPFIVASYRIHKGNPLVSFVDFQDINLIEKYKGALVCVSEEDRGELPEGYYYQDELIGMKVYREEGDYIGTIIDVEETNGAQNNLRVLREDESSVLIPNVPAFVKSVDKEENRMVIHVIEGLL